MKLQVGTSVQVQLAAEAEMVVIRIGDARGGTSTALDAGECRALGRYLTEAGDVLDRMKRLSLPVPPPSSND